MFTTKDAEALGWEIETISEHEAVGRKSLGDDVQEVAVASNTPIFSLLTNIAEREGVGFAAGYGGNQEITPELVKGCSGEKLEQDVPPPPIESEADVLIEKLRGGNATDAEVQAALAKVLGG